MTEIDGATRAAWMSEVGSSAYGNWVESVLELTTPDALYEQYRRDVQATQDEGEVVLSGLPTVDDFVPRLVSGIQTTPGVGEATQDILDPHAAEIMHFTAACTGSIWTPEVWTSDSRGFTTRVTDPHIVHAWNTFGFATGFAMGVANDARIQHTPAINPEEYYGPTRVDRRPEQYARIATLLGSEMMAACLEVASFTGYNVWTDDSRIVEVDEQLGWRVRATHGGLEVPHYSEPVSILNLDGQGQPTGVRDEVVRYLREKWEAQNRDGISLYSQTDGGMAFFDQRPGLSSGCPVGRNGTISTLASFIARELAFCADAAA